MQRSTVLQRQLLPRCSAAAWRLQRSAAIPDRIALLSLISVVGAAVAVAVIAFVVVITAAGTAAAFVDHIFPCAGADPSSLAAEGARG